ncbi:MAG: hypothetical protein H7236_16635 [Gemmatimonadaceae bacterium]|nr:hypothetical protein [Caulobacter sp.]
MEGRNAARTAFALITPKASNATGTTANSQASTKSASCNTLIITTRAFDSRRSFR